MIGYRKRYDLKPSPAAIVIARDPVVGGTWQPGRVLVFACNPGEAGEELHEGRERRIPGPREAADAELTGDPDLARRHAEERGDYGATSGEARRQMTIAGVRITWLLCLNFAVLQWLTLRLARVYIGERTVGWRLLRGIVPLTGWWSQAESRHLN